MIAVAETVEEIKRECLNLLPRWTTGEKAGQVMGPRFRDYERMLTSYTFSEKDLRVLRDDIKMSVAEINEG